MTGKGSRRRPQSTDTPSMCVALTCCQYSLSTRGCTTERGDTAANLSAPVVTPISSLKLYVVLSSVQFLALHPRLPAPVMRHPSPLALRLQQSGPALAHTILFREYLATPFWVRTPQLDKESEFQLSEHSG